MKRKTIAFLVVVSLLALPVMASAAAEFTLGGYLKLHVFWDSTQVGKNLNGLDPRDNVANSQHGRLQFTSTSSRFNFAIKGPEVLGAKTSGYLEVDFDGEGADSRQSASHAYEPRLRHAFFRMNWPDVELLLGQYWSMFCEFYPEMIEDGPFQMTGAPTHRLAQARLTYKTGVGANGSIRLAFLLGKATDASDAPTAQPGQESETPQIEGLVSYEADLWGKGPFYGRPRGFTAQLAGGWQRTRYQSAAFESRFFNLGAGNYVSGLVATDRNQSYLNNWCVMGTLFIPVIPTHTENLAGSASLTVQGWVGEGVGAFGFTGDLTKFTNSIAFDLTSFDRELIMRWGGYLLAQYYFTNEWFMNAAWGYSRTFDMDTNAWLGGTGDILLNGTDLFKYHHDVGVSLYYRPVKALKFGLGYAYTQTKYYQDTTVGSQVSTKGQNHRLQFAGWFFF